MVNKVIDCSCFEKEFLDKIDPLSVVKYLEELNWNEFVVKNEYIRVFQNGSDDDFFQVNVPLEKELRDYRYCMRTAVKTIAKFYDKTVIQVISELLNNKSGDVGIIYLNDIELIKFQAVD